MTGWSTSPQRVGQNRWRFPEPSAMPDGDLVSLGGDLEPETLVDAYRRGIFPMEVSALGGVLGWWSPDPRGIIPLDGMRISRSLRQSAKRYTVRVDTCFDAVIRACGDPAREDGWITKAFIAAYTRLHALGWVHSVEVFDRDGRLAGGLYGVAIGGLFAGESMFHHQRDASKVALMALVDILKEQQMSLLDVQWCTDHLATLGAVAIPRADYLARAADAIGEARS